MGPPSLMMSAGALKRAAEKTACDHFKTSMNMRVAVMLSTRLLTVISHV
jgi:hypothetical protein